jgi:hypothetical protein
MMLFLNFYCNKFIKGKTDDPVLLMIVPCFLVFIIFLTYMCIMFLTIDYVGTLG